MKRKGREEEKGKLLLDIWIGLKCFAPGNLPDNRTQDSKLRSRALQTVGDTTR